MSSTSGNCGRVQSTINLPGIHNWIAWQMFCVYCYMTQNCGIVTSGIISMAP
ncbi:hypothetical protein CEXT_110951, partial [Caerostris extrusa]